MARKKPPATAALRALNQAGAAYSLHEYDYEDKGGTAHAARELGVEEHRVVKTLVMRDSNHRPLVVLMHGDREVSTKALARAVGVKTVSPMGSDEAQKLTGYKVGGISPFGLRREMAVFMQKSILDLDHIFINAGRRGLLAKIKPDVLQRILRAMEVEAAQD